MSKLFLVYSDDEEEIIGIYDSKYKAIERMFKHWCYEEDVDEETLKDDYKDYCGDEDTEDYYTIYKVKVNKSINLDIDYDDGISIPETFEDVQKYLKTEKKKQVLDNLVS
jgi:hypothetical protein